MGSKPLFKWVLDKLVTIKEIDRIIINTDAVKKFETYFHKNNKNKKIIIRNRKKNLCGNKVSINKILRDDIINCNAENFIMTHTTNPFIQIETILRAIKIYKKNIKKCKDSLFSVDEIQNRFYDFKLNPINHKKNKLIQTQDLKPLYMENSNLYIFSRSSFIKSGNRIGNNPIIFSTPKISSIDIDTKEEWNLAKKIIK